MFYINIVSIELLKQRIYVFYIFWSEFKKKSKTCTLNNCLKWFDFSSALFIITFYSFLFSFHFCKHEYEVWDNNKTKTQQIYIAS